MRGANPGPLRRHRKESAQKGMRHHGRGHSLPPSALGHTRRGDRSGLAAFGWIPASQTAQGRGPGLNRLSTVSGTHDRVLAHGSIPWMVLPACKQTRRHSRLSTCEEPSSGHPFYNHRHSYPGPTIPVPGDSKREESHGGGTDWAESHVSQVLARPASSAESPPWPTREGRGKVAFSWGP